MAVCNKQSSSLAVVIENTLAISDNNENPLEFNPNETIYDLRTKNIMSGSLVISVQMCNQSKQALVLYRDELFWISFKSLKMF